MELLKRISGQYPVYKFLDRITPYVPVVEKKVNPEYEARLERLRREQVSESSRRKE